VTVSGLVRCNYDAAAVGERARLRALDLDLAVTDGERDGLELRVHVQLAEDVDVGLHGLRADEQLRRDVVVAIAEGEASKDLPLALGERGE